VRIGLLSQWFEPEPGPPSIPAVLGRELVSRGHRVRVLTGFPNYPTGRVYDGYHLRRRTDGVDGGLSTRRVALYPSHDGSTLGRVLNYGSFALSASVSGTSWMKGVEGLWIYNSPPTIGVPTWLIKARYRPRVVMHVMDLWPESVQASGFGRLLESRPMLAHALDAWLDKTYEVADAIACSSIAQVDLLAERGVPREKLSVVHVWPDESVFRPAPRDEALVSELGLTGKFVLMYAGTLGNAQGLDTLIEACASLGDRPEFQCVIAGGGVAEDRLRARAAELGLSNVSFLGRWPSSDMTRLMAIGDVHLVSLSDDPLGAIAMPSKIQAILASGRPIIVAARGQAADVAIASAAGWTCPPGDVEALVRTILGALGTPRERLAELGQNGITYYRQNFSVTTGVDKVEALLAGRNPGETHVD
jgi:glycosyltransferase involved in cell wall biosynthesis